MGTDPRVDAYIAKAAEFARPILHHLRALVHRALPDSIEDMKWSRPHFLVQGKNVAGMSAFKAHCAFMIHGDGRQGDAMGQYGRLLELSDLPGDAELITKLQEARRRVLEEGTALRKPAIRLPKPDIPMPEALAEALAQTPAARAVFDAFAPSHRREYLEWITEAKTDATRDKRIAQAIAWLAEGKKRHWKYEKC